MKEKRKILFIIFIAACLMLCAVPSAGMLFSKSDESIGNEIRAGFPALLKNDGSLNLEMITQMGDYFEDHYALRPQMITADAYIMASLFGLSNTGSVLTGTDGWLYYSSTLDDFMGRTYLSERGMWNLAHNLFLIQNYVNSRGADFLFMSPPNKNTLYPDNMPYYYSLGVSDTHNRSTLKEVLENAGVSYLDLFSFFDEQEEILYLKEDSHWNNKGAMLVYNLALEKTGKDHSSYENNEVSYQPGHEGDLRKMIYPADLKPESDYEYDIEYNYTYIPISTSSDPVSVEDYRIETANDSVNGSLLMYRDSFGNTLLPLMANAFGHGYFSKALPYGIANDINEYEPDTVIIELVERNLHNIAERPAIIPAPKKDTKQQDLELLEDCITDVQLCQADTSFIEFTGTVPDGLMETDGRIYLELSNEKHSAVYEAFTVTTEESDYAYVLYLQAGQFGSIENARKLSVKVFTDRPFSY